MGLINWIFDIYQHSRIDDAHAEARSARAELAALRSNGNSGGAGSTVDAERLEHALGELALATKTVQRLLVDKGLVTPAEFSAKMTAIDAEDGRLDGRSPV